MGTTPTHGFCIKVRAPSGVHYVNVCSHAAVGLPQDAREREIPEAHLRERGLDNLREPLLTGPARTVAMRKGEALALDVVFAPLVGAIATPPASPC